MLPSMWRSELLHPLSVHFPIALLIVGSLLYTLSVYFNRLPFLKNFKKYSFLVIFIGMISAWIAIYTGSLAEEIVGPNLCDPGIRISHEDFAYYSAYIYTAFCFCYIFSETLSPKLSAFFLFLSVALSIGGIATMGYVGHLGATMTYQQAAGVYNPGPECKGFE